jgi:hypothetical protein
MPPSTAMYTSKILPSWPNKVIRMNMQPSQTSSAPTTILPLGHRRTLRRSRLSALPAYTMRSSTPTAPIAMGRVKAVCYDVVFLQKTQTAWKKMTCSRRLLRQGHYGTHLESSSAGATERSRALCLLLHGFLYPPE